MRRADCAGLYVFRRHRLLYLWYDSKTPVWHYQGHGRLFTAWHGSCMNRGNSTASLSNVVSEVATRVKLWMDVPDIISSATLC